MKQKQIAFFLILIMIGGCQDLQELFEPLPNQTQNLQSPSQKYFLAVPIIEYLWIVTIKDRTGKILYRDSNSTFSSGLNSYWSWDKEDRAWLYNSDNGYVYFWERNKQGWTKNLWGPTCVRLTSQNVDPPLELYPPRQKPATFIHYDTYWQWSGYVGNVATFTHAITEQNLDLKVGETSQGITLLKLDTARDEVQVKLGNKLRVFKRGESCDAAI
jgi:hypothetical protein